MGEIGSKNTVIEKTIGGQIKGRFERLVAFSIETANLLETRLEPISSIDFDETEKEAVEMKNEPWPVFFGRLRDDADSIEGALRRIRRSIDMVEL